MDESPKGSSREYESVSKAFAFPGSTVSSWWSVPNLCATSCAYRDSSKALTEQRMEDVLIGCELARAINATMVEESVPPLSRAHTGTSEIRCRRTASSMRCSISSKHPASEFGGQLPYSGRSQYCRGTTFSWPGAISSRWPGGSFQMRANAVLGWGI